MNSRACLCLEGPPSHRGLVHGRTLKDEIQELVARWKRHWTGLAGVPMDELIPVFLSKTDFVSAVRTSAPGLLDEVKGIAKGAGIAEETMFTFQLLDELILNARGVAAGHCSSIGVRRSGGAPVLIGQNWDIESYVHGFQTVLRIKDDEKGLESLVFTYAGLLAAFGLNSAGVGVCLNSMPILLSAPEGLPVAFVVRGILASTTCSDALRFVSSVEHASPQNYLIGDRRELADLECSAADVVAYQLDDEGRLLYHTNHPLENDDYAEDYVALLEDREHGEQTDADYHKAVEHLEADSQTRLASLRTALEGRQPDEITVDVIKGILSSHDSEKHPVCMDLGGDEKIASIVSAVMELSDEPRFHVAFGPPDVTPYTTYSFSDDC